MSPIWTPAMATRIRIGMKPRYSRATWPRSQGLFREYGISVLVLLHGARVSVDLEGEGDRAREEDGDAQVHIGRDVAAAGGAVHLAGPGAGQLVQSRLLARGLPLPRRRRRRGPYRLVRSIPRERVRVSQEHELPQQHERDQDQRGHPEELDGHLSLVPPPAHLPSSLRRRKVSAPRSRPPLRWEFASEPLTRPSSPASVHR